ELIKSTGVNLTGKHAVVVGRSRVIGQPLALMLLNSNCTVTVCHSHTQDLSTITRQADILCAAVGKINLITKEMVKKGAIVIDVGINSTQKGICGDVDFDGVFEIASLITPVPGGVGPVTTAILMKNVVSACLSK
ncbi:MAG: bifunctional 5,10-methylene-tetrahydrofolate dehydrogenase/5,10-methylene-tetrahydrofolate cyclohydrolase, partial [Firmicutes bacterium]|nr:bifunctional 5,10-methylene-tetrahydrofolate dehydrogenase/5,10-methylene-tetrahydrofolate cyclohydrolase [Bacillota bacterium]